MGPEKKLGFYEEFHKKGSGKVEEMKENKRYRLLRKLVSGDNILVVGCGSKREMGITAKRKVGLDISLVALEKSRQSFADNDYIQADGSMLPFREDSFDCVVCSEVIEHIENPKKMIRAFKRVLSDKGILILTTPNWISVYGLLRKAAEFIFRRPFTAGGQPIDNWYTPKRLEEELRPYFKISELYGIWYYPPLGKGKIKFPDILVYPLLLITSPIDDFLSKALPFFGHMIAVKASLR